MEHLAVRKRQEAFKLAGEVRLLIRQYGHSSKAPFTVLLTLQRLVRGLLHCTSFLQAFEADAFDRSVLEYLSGTFTRVLQLPVCTDGGDGTEAASAVGGGRRRPAEWRIEPDTGTSFVSHSHGEETSSRFQNSPPRNPLRSALTTPGCSDVEPHAVPVAGQHCHGEARDNHSTFEVAVQHPSALGLVWANISGCSDAITTLKQAVVLPHTHPMLFQRGRRPWRAILLYGPPGTGKTTLAATTASEADAVLLTVSAADLLSKWVGDSEKTVRRLFHSAAKYRRCVLFLDEVDALCGERGGSSETEASRRLKTELLLGMVALGGSGPTHGATGEAPRLAGAKDALATGNVDSAPWGYGKQQTAYGTTLIAATNLPWELDAAFRRRFDRLIFVGLPDAAARLHLLNRQLRGVDHSLSRLELAEIAKSTEGYSASDIVRVIQHALLQPISELQEASHFRQVVEGRHTAAPNEKGVSAVEAVSETRDVTSSGSSAEFLSDSMGWVPCEPTASDAVSMTMDDIPPCSLRIGKVHYRHFQDALRASPPTTSRAQLERYAAWESSLRNH